MSSRSSISWATISTLLMLISVLKTNRRLILVRVLHLLRARSSRIINKISLIRKISRILLIY